MALEVGRRACLPFRTVSSSFRAWPAPGALALQARARGGRAVRVAGAFRAPERGVTRHERPALIGAIHAAKRARPARFRGCVGSGGIQGSRVAGVTSIASVRTFIFVEGVRGGAWAADEQYENEGCSNEDDSIHHASLRENQNSNATPAAHVFVPTYSAFR